MGMEEEDMTVELGGGIDAGCDEVINMGGGAAIETTPEAASRAA